MTQTTRSTRTRTRAFAAVALALAVALTASNVDARAGSGTSSGSRGTRTYSAPPSTSTAPHTAAPMERSLAPQPGTQQRPGMGAPSPMPQAQPGGFFSRGGFFPGLVGGLIGAGIGGMLFGGGFFNGIGSFGGLLGFILQILLIVFLVRMALRFFRNRSMGSGQVFAANPMSGGSMSGGPLNREDMNARYTPPGGGIGGGLGGGMGGGPAARRDDVGIAPADYEAFEQVLVTTQTAYGREDLTALRNTVTPEMLSYFAEELATNSSRGVINRLSDVRLLQGDLAEAWREGNSEYATVAMRFSLVDVTVDRGTNRVVQGDPNRPVEVTEVWTFMRSRGGRWLLSAIQQVS